MAGHAGNLVFGRIGNQRLIVMQGRFHYYEGFSMKEVTYPIYVMKLLGVRDLIVTNACGGINPEFTPGDLMIIDDFINSLDVNPLIGDNDERFGPRFPDMSEPYSIQLREKAEQVADQLAIPYRHGVYTLFQGPYYETAAEIRMYALSLIHICPAYHVDDQHLQQILTYRLVIIILLRHFLHQCFQIKQNLILEFIIVVDTVVLIFHMVGKAGKLQTFNTENDIFQRGFIPAHFRMRDIDVYKRQGWHRG